MKDEHQLDPLRSTCRRFNKAYRQHRYLEELVDNRPTVLQQGKLRPPFLLFMLMDSLVLYLRETHLHGILRKSLDFPFGWWKEYAASE